MTTKRKQAQKDKIAQTIKALLAKTVENGATEEEAFAAMQKAREMMDKHGVSAAELEASTDQIKKETAGRDMWGNFCVQDRIAVPVANYCDVKIWMTKADDGKKRYAVLGAEGDRQFFFWLIDALDKFIRLHARQHSKKWAEQKSFIMGCTDRINARLERLIAERRKKVKTSDGKSLMIVKMQLVENAFRSLGLKLRTSNRREKFQFGNSFAAGQAAGDKASFNRPVNNGKGTATIAGR